MTGTITIIVPDWAALLVTVALLVNAAWLRAIWKQKRRVDATPAGAERRIQDLLETVDREVARRRSAEAATAEFKRRLDAARPKPTS